jgi:hypothetical protein
VNGSGDTIIVATLGPTLNRNRAQVQYPGQQFQANSWPGRE